ncbi:unnamed protein product [Oikopleura dioica]|uniref:Uncharacterized protein n=1 Tax=Oikopleura dioica TaxID=34765 RepID=E4XYJ7_OIKDI|nr:unnamed protein product [Oikopleura dioica]
MHRHTRGYNLTRTITGALQAAQDELQQALAPSNPIQLDDVDNEEHAAQLTAEEQQQNWLRNLQLQVPVVFQVSPENTILTARDKIYGPPPPPGQSPEAETLDKSSKKDKVQLHMNPFKIDGQYQLYPSAWKHHGGSRDFLRVGVPFSVTETESVLAQRGCLELEEFSAGLLQRFDSNVARFKDQYECKTEEIDEVRLIIVQLVEAFNLGSPHLRKDLLQMSDYVLRAFVDGKIDQELYKRVIGFASIAGQGRLKAIEGGSAAKRANKPEALQSLAFRMSRFDLLFPNMRKRMLARMFLGTNAAELPSSAHLLTLHDFHGMVTGSSVLPREQKNAWILNCSCEGQNLGSLVAVLPLQKLKVRNGSIPLTTQLFGWENDLNRLRDKVPMDPHRYLVTDLEAEILQKGELEELLSVRQKQIDRIKSSRTMEDFYQGLSEIFPDVPKAVLQFAFYSVRRDGVVELGKFLRQSHGLIRQSQIMTRVHHQLQQVIKRRNRERAIAQNPQHTPKFSDHEKEEYQKLKISLKRLGLQLTHPPLARYWQFSQSREKEEDDDNNHPTDAETHSGYRYTFPAEVRDDVNHLDVISSIEASGPAYETNKQPTTSNGYLSDVVDETITRPDSGPATLNSLQTSRLELMGLESITDEASSTAENNMLNDSILVECDPMDKEQDRDLDMALVLEILDEELDVLVPSYSDDPAMSSLGYGPNPARFSRYEDYNAEEEVELASSNSDYSGEDQRVRISPEDLQKMRNRYIWHSNRQWITHLAHIGWPMEKIMAILDKRHVPTIGFERLAPRRSWWERHMEPGYTRCEPPERTYTISDFINGLANPSEQALKDFPLIQSSWSNVDAHLVFPDNTRPFNRRTVRDADNRLPMYPQTLLDDGEDHSAIRAEVGTFSLWKTPYHGKSNPNYHLQDARSLYCEKRGNQWVTPAGTLSRILNAVCQPRLPGAYLRNRKDVCDLHYQPTGPDIFEETTACTIVNQMGELEERSLVSIGVTHTLLWSPTTTVPAAPSSWTMRMSDGDSHGLSSLEGLAEFISSLAATSKTWHYSANTEFASLNTSTGGRRSGVMVYTPGSPLRDMKTWQIKDWPVRFGANFLLLILCGGGEKISLVQGESMGLSTSQSRKVQRQHADASLVPDTSPYAQPGQMTYSDGYVAPSEVGTYRLERDSNGKRLCWTKVFWKGFGYSYHMKGFSSDDRSGQQILFSCGQHVPVFKIKLLLGLCYYLSATHSDMYARYLKYCEDNKVKARHPQCFNFRFPRCLLPSKWATYVPLLAQWFGREWRDDLQNLFNHCESSGSLMRPFTEASYGSVVSTLLLDQQAVTPVLPPSDVSTDSQDDGVDHNAMEELYRVDQSGRLVRLQDDTSEPDSNGRVGFDYGACFAHESQSKRPPQSSKHYSTKETAQLETL